MANPRTARELHRLQINTQEGQLPPDQGGRRLRGRTVPPVPPPRAPSTTLAQTSHSRQSPTKGRSATPATFSQSKHHQQSSTGMDTSDGESIGHRLNFATSQLRERYRLTDSPDTTMPDYVTSPSPQLSSFGHPGSSDNEYLTPLKQPMPSPQQYEEEIDVDDPLFRPQQRPHILSGEVYFNFRDNLYRTLKDNEAIDPQSGIYHVGRDECYYFTSTRQWKSIPLVDFPPQTLFYWYRSGPLQMPNWPGRRSLLTPVVESPHVSFPDSAFKPVQPRKNIPTITPISQPKPIQPATTLSNRGYQNAIPQYPNWSHGSPQPNPEAQIPYTFQPWNLWHRENQPQSVLTHAQQVEIDRQIAQRLQEIEVARANSQQHVPMSTKDIGSQYDQNEIDANVPQGSPPNQSQPRPTQQRQQNRQPDKFPNHSDHQKIYRHNRQSRESIGVKSQDQKARPQPQAQQRQATPLSHKQNRGQTQRQSQHHWDTHHFADQRHPTQQHYRPRHTSYDQHNTQQQSYSHRSDNRKPPQPWTSTPRDQYSGYNNPGSRSLFGETTTNNSLLNILDTQCRVQQETTQALSSIIKLQDTRANDAFLTDLHSFTGKPDEFLKWIAAIERVASVTGRPARELATAKAEGAVFKCLIAINPSTDWESCKKILRESFSSIQTKEHANSFLMGRSQRANESLQEYIHVFAELAKITTGLDPRQITESMMITLFNKHLYNHHIKKQVCKRSHRTLQCAFDSAMKAEADAKKLEGLSDTNVSVMKIETTSDANGTSSSARNYPNKQGYTKSKYDQQPGRQIGPCYQCSEYGHLARECPKQTNPKVQSSNLDCTNPPRITQTITTESELSASVLNTLISQLNELKTQNVQIKQFVKKHLPDLKSKSNSQNTTRGQQNMTQPKQTTQTTKSQ